MRSFTLVAVLSAMFICGSIYEASAQRGRDYRNVHINAGPEVAFPLNNFNNTHNMAIGGSAQLAIPIAFRFFLLGHVGYNRHFGAGSNDAIALIPYRAGARMRLLGSTYIGAQLGATSLVQGNRNETAFSYAGGIGVANHRIDIGARWEQHRFNTNVETIVVRLAYVIGLQVGSANR